MVAMPVAMLLQLPLPETSVKVAEVPIHTGEFPIMVAGNAFTETIVTAVHPVEVRVKVIMAVPEATPVTIPVEEPIAATPVALLFQVPLPDGSVKVEVDAWHKVVAPVMANGKEFTVTVVVLAHPVVVKV